MSGLCGWFAPAPAAAGVDTGIDTGVDATLDTAIDAMAAPIGRHERTPLRSAFHACGAAALSGSIDTASLYHDDGLIVALWGSPGHDARVLAQRWRSHGAWACAALAGQFAFAILDARSKEALLAVDRFATRPLFYQKSGATMLFASSQDALLRHRLGVSTLSRQAVFLYLALGAMPGAAWEGQRQLEPGECVHLKHGRLVRHAWWRLRFHEHGSAPPDLAAALGPALARVQGQQRSGVLLGGDAASAALAAQLAAQLTAQLADHGANHGAPTFAPAYAAVPAPRRAGAAQHQALAEPADLLDAIPKLAALSDRPLGDSTAFGWYVCARLARAHGVLRLHGALGAAELFGAGVHAQRQRRLARYAALPAALRQLVIEPLLVRLGGPARVAQARRDLPAQVANASAFAPDGAAAMLGAAFGASIDPHAAQLLLQQWWWGAQCRSAANRAIALDLRQGLAPRLAGATLGCALAGVDIALPFLDEAVVDCAARTAPGRKQGRWPAPHARALRAMAPRARAPVASAALPFAHWLHTDAHLRQLAFDSLADLRRRQVVADAVIDGLLARAPGAALPGASALVWQLMMLEQWFVYRAPQRLLHGAAPHGGPGPGLWSRDTARAAPQGVPNDPLSVPAEP